ncbi:MAG: UDP-2,3-diacylglucosamine diphosphatase [Chitinophagales bacterium]|nr:UDP-2,3-diacylglucosamine diphosphatase [Chitinophagales bacterium]
MNDIPILKGKVYFASDLHLGIPDHATSLKREKKFIQWLDSIQGDADTIIIVGDLFDFWFEYRQVVPRGYVRVLGKLAAMHDAGIKIYFFTGNHDQWMKDYFEKELAITVFHEPRRFHIAGRKFLIAHGDGLGPGDHGYKFLKTLFRGKFSRFLFGWLHPDIGVWLGRRWSKNNRLISGEEQAEFLGEDKEWLVQYARTVLKTETVDYFIFGHRHIMLDYKLSDTSRYINLGDWIRFNSYAVFDGTALQLKQFNTEEEQTG